MIIHSFGGAGDWLLGQESAISPEQQAADLGPISPSGESQSGGGGSLADIGKYAGQAGQLIKTGKNIAKAITGKSSSAGTVGRAGGTSICKALYDKCKAFVANAGNQAKYKRLVTALVANTAWQTYKVENLACAAKFKAGGFGSFKKGDAKGNAAAYKKYQACTHSATTRYNSATASSKADQLWAATFREAQSYVTSFDRMVASGAQVTMTSCTSVSEKNLSARISSASSNRSTYLIGALVLVGAGVAAYYLL